MDMITSFGPWLKRRRRALDLTQDELAQAVDYSLSAIRKVEADEARPSKALAEKLAEALRIPADERAAFMRFARDQGLDESALPLPPPPAPPALRPAGASAPRVNLPVPATPLIGRETERRAVAACLRRADARLLTLTGPGGTGKTRLALQVAADLLDDFPDGVFFINLAPVSDPALVLPTIAQTLDVREAPGQAQREALIDYMREKRLLLVLDNFEQVIPAGLAVVALLAAAPLIKVLVTSREVLRLSGEFGYAVPPLPVPPPGLERTALLTAGEHWPDPLPRITQYEAVQLFIQRAQAAKADFHITNANAPAVAEICYRLDGLPLAIELAAARVRLLPPEAILGRLGHRLTVLTGGARDLPARHQTLRNAIAWSYDLLTDDEKALFRRLAVPAGSFTLDAAEAVAGDTVASELLDGVQSLVDKSLLQQDEGSAGEARFEMLDTIREYALEQLAASDDEAAAWRAHALFYVALAEEAVSEIRGPQQVRWYRRLEAETLNWRAALRWSRDMGEAVILARLASALWRFWYRHGVRGEGLEWLEAAAARAAVLPPALRGQLLLGLGVMTMTKGEYEAAQQWFEQALASWPESDRLGRADVVSRLASARLAANDEAMARTLWEESLAINEAGRCVWGAADCHMSLGHLAARHGQHDQARQHFTQSAAGFREAGDLWGMTWPLDKLGELAEREGDYDRAAQFFHEALDIRRTLGLKHAIGVSLTELGEVARCRGAYREAAALYEESITHYREIGAQLGLAINLLNLGFVALRLDEVDRAAALFAESLTRVREINQRCAQVVCLAGTACVKARRGQAVEAARLFSATETLLAERGDCLDPADRIEFDQGLALARAQLDDTTFSVTWEQGQTLSLADAVTAALE